MKWIKWKGKRFLFVGHSLKNGGAIATARQYKNGEPSTAHLFEDGVIRQWGNDVGTRKDIRVIGPADVTPTADAFDRIVFGEPWSRL